MKLLKEFFLLHFLVTFFAKDRIFSFLKKNSSFFFSHDTKLLLCFDEIFFYPKNKTKKDKELSGEKNKKVTTHQ